MSRYFPIVAFLWVVGCAFPTEDSQPNPELAWDFQVKQVGDFPRGKVYLKVNGVNHLVVSEATTNYQQLKREDYADYGVPGKALLASYSWYAGAGDILYVVRKENTVEVYRQEMDEGQDSRYPVKRVLVVPL